MRHWIQGQEDARRIFHSHPFSCVERHAELRNKKCFSFLCFVTKLTLAYFSNAWTIESFERLLMFILYWKVYGASEFSRRFKEKLEAQIKIKIRISGMDTDNI
jgi:hypothetical protein